MKNLSLFLVLFILALSLTGCNTASGDLAKVEKEAAAYTKLAAIEKGAEGLNQFKELYEGKNLLQVLTDADKLLPGLKAETDEFMAKAETESNKDAYLEGVEKRLQRAFVVLMAKSLDDATQSANADAGLKSFKLARAYCKVIEITAKRRGALFNDENKFSNLYESMFNALEERIKAKDSAAVTAIKKQLCDLTDSVYFLSVLYEVKGLVELRGTDDPDEIFAKQVEGSSYFKIIRESAKDAKALAALDNEFAKPASEMDALLIIDNLKVAYPELAAEFKEQF